MQNFMITYFPFILVIVVFYLMVLMPENKRRKKYTAMLSSLNLNDEILTKGGIIGRIVNLQEKYLIVESGPDRARFKLDRNGVSTVIKSANEVEEETKENKKEDKKADK